ncbi:uncharacterized protein TRAVEDRAFT_23388 [Trametes versicolor FP-101664 SS1]|uniref:uncharacterized protein n=1 Tax=Trametes versicolor (strain FP-101664) TaxID=717944 RepID=UPI0004623BF7|nr:uncharacterized protein TRAVEDRAFT_23388 [Trametes versicolor FP-101664 SS1]EIW54233.1 hypothetical protein TRAVEDRAFT_23388 [Trametes versicolor FP-101664 SS1]
MAASPQANATAPLLHHSPSLPPAPPPSRSPRISIPFLQPQVAGVPTSTLPERAQAPLPAIPLPSIPSELQLSAEGLVYALVQLVSDSTQHTWYPSITGLRYLSVHSISAFFREEDLQRVFSVSSGTGQGVERAVIHHAVQHATQNVLFWLDRGNFKYPNFMSNTTTTPERLKQWTAFGALAAIHLFTLSAGPLPIYILRPWFNLAADEPIPTSLTDPVCQFLMNAVNQQPAIVRLTRAGRAEVHDSWSSDFMGKVLFPDSRDDWEVNQEFLAFSAGFNTPLGGGTTLISTMEPFVGAHGVPAFIAALYDRTVKTPSQVIDKLSPQYHYSGVQPAHLLLQRLFVACLVRYLNGKGHPDHPELRASGLVEDDQFITRQDDVALRSQMFLKAVSDTWAVPLDPDWSIKRYRAPSKTRLPGPMPSQQLK